MDLLKSILKEFWNNEFPNLFHKGVITYERQLQAELYCFLKNGLSPEYKIWIEPNISLLNSPIHAKKPDLIITYQNEIKAIIELKYTLSATPLNYDEDLAKLYEFKNESLKSHKLVLGYIPVTLSSSEDKLYNELLFDFNSNYSNILVVFSRNSIDLHRLIEKPNDHINSKFLNSLNDLVLLTGSYTMSNKLQLNILV